MFDLSAFTLVNWPNNYNANKYNIWICLILDCNFLEKKSTMNKHEKQNSRLTKSENTNTGKLKSRKLTLNKFKMIF